MTKYSELPHEEKIYVESQAEVGSEFSFTLEKAE